MKPLLRKYTDCLHTLDSKFIRMEDFVDFLARSSSTWSTVQKRKERVSNSFKFSCKTKWLRIKDSKITISRCCDCNKLISCHINGCCDKIWSLKSRDSSQYYLSIYLENSPYSHSRMTYSSFLQWRLGFQNCQYCCRCYWMLKSNEILNIDLTHENLVIRHSTVIQMPRLFKPEKEKGEHFSFKRMV